MFARMEAIRRMIGNIAHIFQTSGELVKCYGAEVSGAVLQKITLSTTLR